MKIMVIGIILKKVDIIYMCFYFTENKIRQKKKKK